MTKGSATVRGSPKGTMGSEKLAVTCRTFLIVPCGVKCCTWGAGLVSPASLLVLGKASTRKVSARQQRKGHCWIGETELSSVPCRNLNIAASFPHEGTGIDLH